MRVPEPQRSPSLGSTPLSPANLAGVEEKAIAFFPTRAVIFFNFLSRWAYGEICERGSVATERVERGVAALVSLPQPPLGMKPSAAVTINTGNVM